MSFFVRSPGLSIRDWKSMVGHTTFLTTPSLVWSPGSGCSPGTLGMKVALKKLVPGLPVGKSGTTLQSLVLMQYQCVMNGWTDRQVVRQTGRQTCPNAANNTWVIVGIKLDILNKSPLQNPQSCTCFYNSVQYAQKQLTSMASKISLVPVISQS